MVFFMSIYNVACHHGTFNLEIIKDAWLGFPIAYCFAMCCDWFLVSGLAKGFAFRFLVKPESEPFKKAIAVSCCMAATVKVRKAIQTDGCSQAEEQSDTQTDD